ncbi:hypothetical protein SNEBB_010112 [Seison nebaliae]|nr:hypothetical protein SNEBB_010112 [Seison nebaliae]
MLRWLRCDNMHQPNHQRGKYHTIFLISFSDLPKQFRKYYRKQLKDRAFLSSLSIDEQSYEEYALQRKVSSVHYYFGETEIDEFTLEGLKKRALENFHDKFVEEILSNYESSNMPDMKFESFWHLNDYCIVSKHHFKLISEKMELMNMKKYLEYNHQLTNIENVEDILSFLIIKSPNSLRLNRYLNDEMSMKNQHPIERIDSNWENYNYYSHCSHLVDINGKVGSGDTHISSDTDVLLSGTSASSSSSVRMETNQDNNSILFNLQMKNKLNEFNDDSIDHLIDNEDNGIYCDLIGAPIINSNDLYHRNKSIKSEIDHQKKETTKTNKTRTKKYRLFGSTPYTSIPSTTTTSPTNNIGSTTVNHAQNSTIITTSTATSVTSKKEIVCESNSKCQNVSDHIEDNSSNIQMNEFHLHSRNMKRKVFNRHKRRTTESHQLTFYEIVKILVTLIEESQRLVAYSPYSYLVMDEAKEMMKRSINPNGIVRFHSKPGKQLSEFDDILSSFNVNTEHLNDLMDMGFDKHRCIVALRKFNNKFDSAMDWLLEESKKTSSNSLKNKDSNTTNQNIGNNMSYVHLTTSIPTTSTSSITSPSEKSEMKEEVEDVEESIVDIDNRLHIDTLIADMRQIQHDHFRPHRQSLEKLMQLGFPADFITEMLKHTKNNPSQSLDLLLDEKCYWAIRRYRSSQEELRKYFQNHSNERKRKYFNKSFAQHNPLLCHHSISDELNENEKSISSYIPSLSAFYEPSLKGLPRNSQMRRALLENSIVQMNLSNPKTLILLLHHLEDRSTEEGFKLEGEIGSLFSQIHRIYQQYQKEPISKFYSQLNCTRHHERNDLSCVDRVLEDKKYEKKRLGEKKEKLDIEKYEKNQYEHLNDSDDSLSDVDIDEMEEEYGEGLIKSNPKMLRAMLYNQKNALVHFMKSSYADDSNQNNGILNEEEFEDIQLNSPVNSNQISRQESTDAFPFCYNNSCEQLEESNDVSITNQQSSSSHNRSTCHVSVAYHLPQSKKIATISNIPSDDNDPENDDDNDDDDEIDQDNSEDFINSLLPLNNFHESSTTSNIITSQEREGELMKSIENSSSSLTRDNNNNNSEIIRPKNRSELKLDNCGTCSPNN